MTTKIFPSSYYKKQVELLVQDIQTSNSYYFFVGSSQPQANSELINSVDLVNYDPYDNMVFGKQISANSVLPAIRNIPYTAGLVYDKYDDAVDLGTKDFYAIVNTASYYHVFKCLDNNNETPSSVTPDFADITGANVSIYQTSDGYVWKYMYTIDNTTANKFKNSKWFPVVPNTAVSTSATVGSVDVIFIENTGKYYNNYLTGSFGNTDIRINGNNILYAVSNSMAATVNGYYTGCLLYISSGAGYGEYRTVVDYISNGNGNFIVLNSDLTSPTNGTGYQIYPQVQITGSGSETSNAVARALVNSLSSNSIYKVELIQRGQNYTYYTANVVANSVVDVYPAVLRPVLVPAGGHGSDVLSELQSTVVAVSVQLSNTEANTVPATNDYRQIGLVRSPTFSNVTLNLNTANTSFIAGETIYNAKPLYIGNGAVNTTSNVLTLAVGQPYLSPGPLIVQSANLTSFVNTFAVINSTAIRLPANCSFACTSAYVYSANVFGSGTLVVQQDSKTLVVNSYSGQLKSNDYVIGSLSAAVSTVNTVSRSAVTKDLKTFVQMHKYTGTVTGTFVADELLVQGSNTAYLHSFSSANGTITFYTTNQNGNFTVGSVVSGSNSHALCTIASVYPPELNNQSGEVVYLENVEAIPRLPTQTETFTLYFNLQGNK